MIRCVNQHTSVADCYFEGWDYRRRIRRIRSCCYIHRGEEWTATRHCGCCLSSLIPPSLSPPLVLLRTCSLDDNCYSDHPSQDVSKHRKLRPGHMGSDSVDVSVILEVQCASFTHLRTVLQSLSESCAMSSHPAANAAMTSRDPLAIPSLPMLSQLLQCDHRLICFC